MNLGGGSWTLANQGWVGHVTGCGLPPITRAGTSLESNQVHKNPRHSTPVTTKTQEQSLSGLGSPSRVQLRNLVIQKVKIRNSAQVPSDPVTIMPSISKASCMAKVKSSKFAIWEPRQTTSPKPLIREWDKRPPNHANIPDEDRPVMTLKIDQLLGSFQNS